MYQDSELPPQVKEQPNVFDLNRYQTSLFIILVIIYLPCPLHAYVERNIAAVGNVIAVKGDEKLKFIEQTHWSIAEVEQPLVAGDQARTGPYGGLAILFLDQTQIRVHRNTSLIINHVGNQTQTDPTRINIKKGSIWSRAKKLPKGLLMETPSATAAIRGTDWHLHVEDTGNSVLTVLSGEVDFFNSLGTITVKRGEIGIVEKNKAPLKKIIITPKDKPHWVLSQTINWLDLISLSGQPTRQVLLDKHQLLVASKDADLETKLRLTEIYYDSGDFSNSEKRFIDINIANIKDNELKAKAQLILGYLSLKRYDLAQAKILFEQAKPHLNGRYQLLSHLGLLGIDIEQQKFTTVDKVINKLLLDYPSFAEVYLIQAWLRSFAGEYQQGIRLLQQNKNRFATDARFPAFLAEMYLMVDETVNMKTALDNALTLDKQSELAWQLTGLYYHHTHPNAVFTLQAYTTALEINPFNATNWTNLGGFYLDRGEYDAAELAFDKALRLERKASTLANMAYLLINTEKLNHAEHLLTEALALDPSDSMTLLAMNFLALKQGNTNEAILWALKAIVANPDMAFLYTWLSVAYYQAEQFSNSDKSLTNARRIDTNDPVPDLIASLAAQDQSKAGLAIQRAQSALKKYERWDNLHVENLSSNREGSYNMGAAYVNLGLNEWGQYYGQRSYSPYSANSHFFLSQQYASISRRARRSKEVLGLILNPTAISLNTRNFEFIRQPRHDTLIGLAQSLNKNTRSLQTLFKTQGYSRFPQPLSYSFSFENNQNKSQLKNNNSNTRTFAAVLGARLNHKNSFSFDVLTTSAKNGRFGSIENPELDDREQREKIVFFLGYQHRFGPQNRMLLKLLSSDQTYQFTNDNPFGLDLSNRDLSLIRSYGFDGSNALYAQGLYDATVSLQGTSNNPIFIVGPAGNVRGLTPLVNTLPQSFDAKPTASITNDTKWHELQFRHFFTLGKFQLTYGVDWMPFENSSEFKIKQLQQIGTATLTNGQSPSSFPYLESSTLTTTRSYDGNPTSIYFQGRWQNQSKRIQLDVGLFKTRYYSGVNTANKYNPRMGIAWHIMPRSWLRLAAQRELLLIADSSLSPVSTLGLVADDRFLQQGWLSTDYQIRWDTEWNTRFFTFAHVEQQSFEDLNDFSSIADTPIDPSVTLSKGKFRQIAAGINIWLANNLGGSLSYHKMQTWNRSADDVLDLSIRLIPERFFTMKLYWVHPKQLRITLQHIFVGHRMQDIANTKRLPSYWQTNLAINWQPLNKRLFFTLSGQNLFANKTQPIEGTPESGRMLFFQTIYYFN